MSRPPRVLHLTTALGGDGASRSLQALVDHRSRPWHARLCTLRRTEESALRTELDMPGPSARPSAIGAWLHLARAVRRWRPDVLHTQLSRADWLGRVAGVCFGIPVVSTIQNVHSRMYRAEFGPVAARVGIWLDRITIPLAARLVAVSAAVADDLRRFGARAVDVIPNGIDIEELGCDVPRAEARRLMSIGEGEFAVVALSLLKPQKGIDLLVRAAECLGTRGAGMRVLVFGEGPERGRLEAMIRKPAPGGARVELRGWRPAARQWLRGADAFVMPSRWEGLPVALLEAMARGLPCVVTSVAGIEDIAVDGANAWVVPAENPGALAMGLARLREEPERAAQLGRRAALEAAQRFAVERVIEAYARLFQGLGRRRSGG